MSRWAISACFQQHPVAASVGATSENCCQLSDIIIY